MKEMKTIIGGHAFLRGIEPKYVDLLARHAKEAEFKPGQVVFRQNQPAYELYLILDGKVGLESLVPMAGDLPLQVIGGGDVLGWSWLFPPFILAFPGARPRTVQGHRARRRQLARGLRKRPRPRLRTDERSSPDRDQSFAGHAETPCRISPGRL